jgi:LAO/AO transport system kinase
MLTGHGHRIAVLAVDPSSTRTGGSILGDKTRMARLAVDANAFIRPSPTGGSLGGVAAKTREAMLLTEAAGYDVVLVETVGVGQSEVAVAGMVDCFVALMAPGTGDDLQGIKKGLLELADIVLVNKADGDSVDRAHRAAADYRAALRIVTPHDSAWMPPVLTVSALTGTGLDAFWAQVQAHRGKMQATGAFARKRAEQRVAWMWTMFEARTMAYMRAHPTLRDRLPGLERAVRDGELPPSAAADEMWRALGLAE